MSAPNWIEAGPTESLIENGSTIFKYDNKQILIIHSEGKFYVCNNRCPHEGFPLREGTVTGKCILTCNWHNWKFDLETGKTLVGGDQLRRYPTKIENDTLFIDVTDPPATDRIPEIMANLDEAMDDYDYTRIARELARLEKVDADPLDAVRFAIQKTSNKFEWGMTHAYAAAADWLTLREQHASDPSRALTCLLEPIAHMAWDTLREKEYPYTNEEKPFDGPSLVAAFEAENEDEVIGLLRGALSSGMSYPDLEPWLAEVALAHYADFGHSAIYVFKCGQLIEQLGNDVLEPVLFALARPRGNSSTSIPRMTHIGIVQSHRTSAGSTTPTCSPLPMLQGNSARDMNICGHRQFCTWRSLPVETQAIWMKSKKPLNGRSMTPTSSHQKPRTSCLTTVFSNTSFPATTSN